MTIDYTHTHTLNNNSCIAIHIYVALFTQKYNTYAYIYLNRKHIFYKICGLVDEPL